MNSYFYYILFFFLFPDLSLKAQGIVSALDSCKIPSVITPNEDGLHDEFRIPCLADDNPDSEISILNEWGDRVFFARPYKNNWRALYKNEPLPDGTYFYILKRHKIAQPEKGYVVVFR
jgi:gliding motility-associated-like protein